MDPAGASACVPVPPHGTHSVSMAVLRRRSKAGLSSRCRNPIPQSYVADTVTELLNTRLSRRRNRKLFSTFDCPVRLTPPHSVSVRRDVREPTERLGRIAYGLWTNTTTQLRLPYATPPSLIPHHPASPTPLPPPPPPTSPLPPHSISSPSYHTEPPPPSYH